MKYTGKEFHSLWHTVTDDNDRKYWVALSARVVLDEHYHTMANDIKKQKDMEYTVFTIEKGKPFPATWPGIFDEDLRKRIILCAWPMVLE